MGNDKICARRNKIWNRRAQEPETETKEPALPHSPVSVCFSPLSGDSCLARKSREMGGGKRCAFLLRGQLAPTFHTE